MQFLHSSVVKGVLYSGYRKGTRVFFSTRVDLTAAFTNLFLRPSIFNLFHRCLGLRILTLTDVGTSSRHSPRKCKQLLRLLVRPFHQLTSLDLSNWVPVDMNFLSHVAGTMQALVLYNVPRSNIEKGLDVICG